MGSRRGRSSGVARHPSLLPLSLDVAAVPPNELPPKRRRPLSPDELPPELYEHGKDLGRGGAKVRHGGPKVHRRKNE